VLNILGWFIGKGQRGTGFEIPEHYLAMLTGNPIASLSIPI
jgi:hypothetical protein